jgi:hypothetical protein
VDAKRFDNVLRSLFAAPSRRDVARTLAGLIMTGALGARFAAEDTEAKKGKRRKKKKKKGCQPNCDGRNCGSDGCSGTCGTCGACQSCQGGRCQSHCTAAQQCLAHQSCALTCTIPNSSKPACDGFSTDCSCGETAEGGLHCRFSGCSAGLETCASTTDCPASQVCQNCSGTHRCVAICNYQCTSDAQCRPICHCSASNTEGRRHCELNGDCGDLCDSSTDCVGNGVHCSFTDCAGNGVEKRCVKICGTNIG